MRLQKACSYPPTQSNLFVAAAVLNRYRWTSRGMKDVGIAAYLYAIAQAPSQRHFAVIVVVIPGGIGEENFSRTIWFAAIVDEGLSVMEIKNESFVDGSVIFSVVMGRDCRKEWFVTSQYVRHCHCRTTMRIGCLEQIVIVWNDVSGSTDIQQAHEKLADPKKQKERRF